MNQFRDNPYESPVLAELNERPVYQPPRVKRKKSWPPFFAFFWLICGPFICLWIFRYCFHVLKLFTFEDDPVYVFFYLITGVLWLIALARVGIWLIRSLFA